MKVAVTYERGNIFQHFGHTEQFKIYEIENNTISSSSVVGTNGLGHEPLAGFLKEHGVETLICGGVGGGAKEALTLAGIKLYGGIQGDADEAVNKLLNGTLPYNPEANCDHHDEHHNGDKININSKKSKFHLLKTNK